LVGKPKERSHYADIGIDGSTILKWILKIEDERAYTGEVWVTGALVNTELRLVFHKIWGFVD
jgi:hypothetical protein